MKKIKVYRHGDVMIWSGAKIPKRIKLEVSKVLHKGENHSHDIISGRAEIGENNGHKYLRCKRKITLDHIEHGKATLPAGDYEIKIKVEYDHFLEESKQVVD